MNLTGFETYLKSNVTLGTVPVFISTMPATVSRAVALLNDNVFSKSDMELLGRHSGGFQIIVRDADYQRGQNLAYAIHAAFLIPGGGVFDDIRAYYVLPKHLPLCYPRPASDLLEWTTNFAVEYTRGT